jgi:predicted ATPase
MNLKRYKIAPPTGDNFSFDETTFSRVNLIVGDSGTGKSRFVNTIDNFFKQLVGDNKTVVNGQIVTSKLLFPGSWDVDFESDGEVYSYKLEVSQSTKSQQNLSIENEILTHKGEVLFERKKDSILWKGQRMPKLSSDQTCFALLDDDDILPLRNGMRKVIARRFYDNELRRNFQIGTVVSNTRNTAIPPHIKSIGDLAVEPMDFHNKMYYLNVLSPSDYSKVVSLIKMAFPIIVDAGIQNLINVLPNFQGALNTHVFCIKERGINNWIPTHDISSGMQKLFLLILDTVLLQEGGILLIDEYENSLGVSAINFLPDLIDNINEKCQFIITSHHPYIINNIPIESWKVFHREGMHVHITDGKDLKEKYSRSRQDHFVQLINDPLYNGAGA